MAHLKQIFFHALLWCVTSIMVRSWFLNMTLHQCAVQLVALLGKCSLKSFDRVWQMFTFPAPFKILVCDWAQLVEAVYIAHDFTASPVAVPFTSLQSQTSVRSSVKCCCFAGVVVCDVLKGHSAFILRVQQSKKNIAWTWRRRQYVPWGDVKEILAQWYSATFRKTGIFASVTVRLSSLA